jgi:hypothetical protein
MFSKTNASNSVARISTAAAFEDNEFYNSVFVFTDAAVRTMYFLSNMCHAGEGGEEVVEKTFEDIRMRNFHGHEVATEIPHTADHSLR